MKNLKVKKGLVTLLAFALITALLTGSLWAQVKSKKVKISAKAQKYQVKVEYPHFINPKGDAGLKKINKNVANSMRTYIKDFKGEASKAEIFNNIKWSLDYNYKIHYNEKGIISLVLYGYDFQGGAHGMPVYMNYLFDVKTGKDYKFKELFKPGSGWLKWISKYCINELKGRDLMESDWMEDGAAPVEKNYNVYYFEGNNFVVVFPSYQVAPYAAGPQEIKIPFAKLKKYAKKGTPLYKAAQ